MRLAVVVSSLARGGAEGVAALLANGWSARGHAVTVITFTPPTTTPQQVLNASVVLRQLGLLAASASPLQALFNNLRRVRMLRRTLASCDADVVVAHGDSTNVLTLLASPGLGLRTYVVEHVDPRQHPLPRSWRLLRHLAYRRATAIVTVSRGILDALPHALRRRAYCIWNPISEPPAGPLPALDGELIVAMGRLTAQKGFDLLLEAFAAVRATRPGLRLRIYGEGPARAALEAQRRSLGLDAAVDLPGATSEPAAALRAGKLFVLSSRYEGFGLVLAEAMALGLPVVATDCPSGPADIVRDGVDGLLVPPGDVAALAEAMARLLDDPVLARQLAARAGEVLERFSLERTLLAWDTLFGQREIRQVRLGLQVI
ncbi:MAG: glycosyltransferase family 4 protein [Gammaproteobacteria bacterium]